MEDTKVVCLLHESGFERLVQVSSGKTTIVSSLFHEPVTAWISWLVAILQKRTGR